MDSGGSTVMQSNSEPFKQEDPLMSRLKEILLQQEMIEKRLKESRILANQPNSSTTKMATISSNANSAVVVQVNGHEVHDCNDIDNIGTKDTCNDHQESKSSEPEEKKKKEVDGKVEKVANEEAGEKKEFRSKESNEEEEEVKAGSKCSNDAIGIDKSVGNDSALDLNVSQNSHEIDTNRPLVGKSNRSGDDQVDRAVTDKSIESEMHPHDGADDADDDHHPIDDSSSLGGGRDDSAFGDSVESFGGDLDTSSERTESSPEPFVMHDENNNPLFDSPPEIELIIRVSSICCLCLTAV